MMKVAKRVLTRDGIQYFDAGGNVLQPSTLAPQNTAQNATGTNALTPGVNPGSALSPGLAAYNPSAFTSDVGGIATGIGAAFTAQNGYQAQLAPTQLTDYSGIIAPSAGNALTGQGTFNASANQQQQLINALQAQSQGQGPNAAQAALNQNTAANVNAQGALEASQRGASANAGLIARQAAQTGAGVQQNAVAQAATLQAQQEQAAQAAALTGQENLTGAVTGQQNANTSLLNTAASAANTQNTGEITNLNNAQTINSGVAAANAAATNKTTGGLLGGASSLLSALAKGGVVPDHYQKMISLYHPHVMTSGGKVPGNPKVNRDSYKNDVVPAILTPKEIVLPLSVTQAKNAPEAAKAFVAKALGQSMSDTDTKEDEDDFKAAVKRAISTRKGASHANA